MDLDALQNRLRQFAAERDWQPFHTPKNLAMALMVEAAELAELFQWLTPEQSQGARSDTGLQRRVGDELADVLLYLVQLADHSGVDLDRAVAAKLLANARKHPPTRPGRPVGTAPLPRQTHVLLDYENVQPDDEALRALVPGVTDLWLFYGPHQKRIDALFESFGDRVTRVPIARVGKNSLDFHLSFYVGYIAATHPDARLVVLANDQGYAPMLEHAEALGFEATLVGHARARRPAARTVARKTAPAGRRKASKAPPDEASAAPVRAPAKATVKPTAMPPPASTRTRARRAPSTRAAAAAAPAERATVADDMSRAPTRRTGNRAARPPAATPIAAPATKSVTKPATAAAKAPDRAVAKAAAKATAPQPSARRPASALPKSPLKAAKPQTSTPMPTAPPRRPAAALHKLTEQLRRLGDALPKKQAPLRRLLQSLLGPTADDAALQSALAGLVAAGLLAIDERGAVSYTLSPPSR